MEISELKEKFSKLNQNIKYAIYGIGGIAFVGTMALMIHASHKKNTPMPVQQTQTQSVILRFILLTHENISLLKPIVAQALLMRLQE